MTARRRCTRGHFIPATAPTSACHCTLTPRPRRRIQYCVADLYGQRIPAGARIHTVPITGSYL